MAEVVRNVASMAGYKCIPLAAPATEGEAFAGMVHGLYLSIFQSWESLERQTATWEKGAPSILDDRITRLIYTHGLDVLTKSFDEPIQRCARRCSDMRADGVAKISVVDLITLSVQCNADEMIQELLVWVVVAYGTSLPKMRLACPWSVDMDGSLTRLERSVVISPEICSHAVDRDPFWRWLDVVTRAYLNEIDPLKMLCTEVLSKVALPLVPMVASRSVYVEFLPLPNIVRILMLLGGKMSIDQGSLLRSVAMARLITRGQTGFYPVGMMNYLKWVKWVVQFSPTSSDCYVVNQILNSAVTSDHVISIGDKDVRSRSLNIAFEALKTKPADIPPDEAEEPDDTGEGTVADGLTGPTAGGDPAAALSDNAIDPSKGISGDNIDLISLNRDPESVNTYLYKRAVLALCATVGQNPDIVLSEDKVEDLRDWCQDWLWVTDVSQTQKLIRGLGLQAVLKPIEKLKG